MSSALILATLAAVSITLRRPTAAATYDDDGLPVQSFADTTITASVQSGGTSRALAHNPEGERQSQRRRVITESELRAANPATGTLADRVVIDGLVYEVQNVRKVVHLLPHYAADVLALQEVE